ncbi:hypothetical protein H6G74_28125 [Nostoc spongiaeforme FACHB-130]|uniref:Uncharacterized protein n=1 Tax=Nostoc spongiaeforme FACHB-130 TaxID=1357510 RepID=A0ABR8G4T9_9NOSO|nr:hypothetical protein [Nostoc spongiaeforme]MBD2598164.1 hypothetical protein [Nostoc spongiaeforme FACHB-130]
MDFAIRNPVMSHASHIDEKAQTWGGFNADILSYLSDINKLEQFADYANNAQELADRLEPFLDNAKVVFEAMEKLTKGQVTWTELRKQYGSHVATAIAKIRKLNSEFDSEMSRVDAQDRADLLRIDQKRKHALAEVAAQLHHDLQAELWRHENKISSIENRQTVQAQRQAITTGLREKRQQLLARARYGTRALEPNSSLQEVIPFQAQNSAPTSSVSATGTVRGWGAMLGNLWQKLGDR